MGFLGDFSGIVVPDMRIERSDQHQALVNQFPNAFFVSFDTNHKIMDVKIAEDGKSGTVKDISFISNRVKMQAADKWIEIDVQTQSTCDDNVVVTQGSMVQLQISTCTAESYFFPVKARNP